MSKPDGYMVIFDDGGGATVPMGWDPLCEGALEALDIDQKKPAVVFSTRQLARKHIGISRAFAQLRRKQGEVLNEDFLPANNKCIKIVPIQYVHESDVDDE